MALMPDSNQFFALSSKMSLTVPVATSAVRSVALVWSRADETKARDLPSFAHCTSSQPPKQLTSSHCVERCWSGAIFRRTIFAVGTSITTRSIIVMSLSPTNGYFQVSTFGAPTLVETTVIELVLRWSCWKVAIFDESGDHTRIALSSCTQPALLVAYPKSLMPSVVS